MPIVNPGFVHEGQVAELVSQAASKLGKDVVRLRHSIGSDTAGDPAIFFRVVLTDEASIEANLGDVVEYVIESVTDELRPLENWGLLPYFDFRSESEEAMLNDPKWS